MRYNEEKRRGYNSLCTVRQKPKNKLLQKGRKTMKKRHVWIGLIMLVMAALIVCSRYNLLGNVEVFDVTVTALMIYAMIDGVRRKSFFLLFFPLAIIGILYDTELHLTAITPYPILVIATLLSCGLRLIFPGKTDVMQNGNTETKQTSRIDFSAKCSGASWHPDAQNIREVFVRNMFSGNELCLDKVGIEGPVLELYLYSSFSGTDVYIPQNWTVVDHTKKTCSVLNISERACDVSDKTVHLYGKIRFSNVDIKYM